MGVCKKFHFNKGQVILELILVNSKLGKFFIELIDLFVDLFVNSLFFSLEFDSSDLFELFFERGFSRFGVFPGRDDDLV